MEDLDANYNDVYDEVGDTFSSDWKPQEMNFDMFKLRNDPSELIEEIKLLILNAKKVVDKENPNKINIVPISNGVKPRVNKQGLADILFAVKSVVNNHAVMGNTANEKAHNVRMLAFSDHLTILVFSKQEEWELKLDDANPLINFLVHLVDIFLSRTLADKERVHYGQGFKEERQMRPQETKKRNPLAILNPATWGGNRGGFAR